MLIKHRIYNNILFVMLDGELDEHTAKHTTEILDKLFDEEIYKQVIFDLSDLKFMDSTGIGVLLGRYRKLKGKGIGVYITNPSKHAEKIFNLTGLYDIMPKIS